MRQLVRPRRNGIPSLVLVAVPLVVVVLTIAFVVAQPRATNPPPAPAAAPHFVDVKAPGAPRIVVIGRMTDALPGTSNEAGYLMANLRSGQIPAGATTATVLSDSNCAPDADGISHCLNDLQIGNVIVTVQHHHNMNQVPCLSPGEAVALMSLADYQRP